MSGVPEAPIRAVSSLTGPHLSGKSPCARRPLHSISPRPFSRGLRARPRLSSPLAWIMDLSGGPLVATHLRWS